jgi:glycosyltransferase involved in cell wall biosynthesis
MGDGEIAQALDRGAIAAYHIWMEDLELCRYLIRNYPAVTTLKHPFMSARGTMDDLASVAVTYENGQETGRKRYGPPPLWEPLFWARTILVDLAFLGRGPRRGGVFFGVDNLNALAGLILRTFGRVDKVVYYSLDFRPKLSRSPVANYFYRRFDKMCCRRADLIWVLDRGLMEERFRRGLNRERTAPYQVVPWGTNFTSIKRRGVNEINKTELIYMGGLSEEKGVEVAIRAMPLILEKIPGATLTILGTGRQEQYLKQLAADVGADKSIDFRGFIPSHSEMEEAIAMGAVGLAPYKPHPDNYTNFTDPAKPKNYMACGLPVLITDVPETARRIAENRAGLLIEYSPESLAAAACRLLGDEPMLTEFKANAVKMAAGSDWTKILKSAFAEL